MNEELKADLVALQRDLQLLLKPVLALAKVKKSSKADVIDQLVRVLERFPATIDLGPAVDEIRARAQRVVTEGRRQREGTLKQVVGGLVGLRKGSGEDVREVASGWRIGRFELEVDTSHPRVRVLYNKEALVPWSAVAAEGDLDALLTSAARKLETAELPTERLVGLFWSAFEGALNAARKVTPTTRVPLREFYRAVRVELVRDELATASHPDARLKHAEFPTWAFLYNLDRYRSASAEIPPDKSLVLETGSQQDHQKGMAMVLNGLKATQDYKSYCYIYSQI
jgi:hypothetical protein